MGQLVWRVCRDLVRAATRGYAGSSGSPGGAATNTRALAEALGTTPGVVQRMMCPSDPLNFRADQLMVLMTAETLVPEAARMLAGAVLAREWGGVFVPQSAEVVRGEAVKVAALELSADAGLVAGLVAHAQADGAIDDREREAIDEAALAAQRDAGQVMAAVGTSPQRRVGEKP